MIKRPTRGIAKSVKAHNVDLSVLCDWVEASAILFDDELSIADVIDTLLEEGIYLEQDFASHIVIDAWIELKRRKRLCGTSYCIKIDSEWVKSLVSWKQRPEHIFCLMLSLATKYDWWFKEFGQDYTQQGELFERLTEESLKTLSPDWDTHLTGWSRSNAAGFPDIAQRVAQIVGTGNGNISGWNLSSTGDKGLDLLFYRPFPDKRLGFPYILIQCASGADWVNKLEYPNLDLWRNLINPVTKPVRGFAVPFCLSDKKFEESSIRVAGLFIDRCRLLGASGKNENWVPNLVADGIVEWAEPRVNKLTEISQY